MISEKDLTSLNIKREISRAFSETITTSSFVAYPTTIDGCLNIIDFCKKNGLSICPRGGGFTYGDMILNDGHVILNTLRMNDIMKWDANTGQIVVGPGVTFTDIFKRTLSDNWVLSSCPGGMGVTIGGAISNNVHGKDSWKNGNFGDQVISLKLLTSGGQSITVDRDKNRELFEAVIGGMGLLGIIVEATLQLKKIPSPFVEVSVLPVRNIEECIETLESSRSDSDFFIAWVDAFAWGADLGRGYVTKAKWIDTGMKADAEKLSKSLKVPTRIFGILPARPTWYLLRPFFQPFFIKSVNAAHYLLSRVKAKVVSNRSVMLFTDYNFMHNKIPDIKHVYRPHGFFEFQPILPRKAGIKAIKEYFTLCRDFGCQSLLCGVKVHREDDYMISFSGNGYSLPVVIQLRGRDKKQADRFARAIVDFVMEREGKIFLAKNDFLSTDVFKRMYPRYEEFVEVKRRLDPLQIFSSDMYRRLIKQPDRPTAGEA